MSESEGLSDVQILSLSNALALLNGITTYIPEIGTDSGLAIKDRLKIPRSVVEISDKNQVTFKLQNAMDVFTFLVEAYKCNVTNGCKRPYETALVQAATLRLGGAFETVDGGRSILARHALIVEMEITNEFKFDPHTHNENVKAIEKELKTVREATRPADGESAEQKKAKETTYLKAVSDAEAKKKASAKEHLVLPKGLPNAKFDTLAKDIMQADVAATHFVILCGINFMKMNHHYINTKEATEKFRKDLAAAQVPAYVLDLADWDIAYPGVHFFGPYNAMMLTRAKIAEGKVARSLKMKVNAFPAGVAVITTQLAVWKAILAIAPLRKFEILYKIHLIEMREAADRIKKNPHAFHINSHLFGVTSETATIESAMSKASELAAIAQAFIDTLASKSPIANAAALRKHSENNIALYVLASTLFKGFNSALKRLARVEDPTTILSLGTEKIRVQASAIQEEEDDNSAIASAV